MRLDRSLLRLSLGCCAGGLVALLSSLWLNATNPTHAADSQELPPWASMPKAAIHALTLGHPHLYEDFLYLWLVQSLTPQADEPPLTVERLQTALAVTKHHKPRFEALYLIGAFASAIELRQAALGEAFLKIGLSVFPESWRILMSLGYLYAFPLDEPLQAAAYYHLAAQQKRSPPYVRSLARKMLEKKQWSASDAAEVLAVVAALPHGESVVELLRSARPKTQPDTSEQETK